MIPAARIIFATLVIATTVRAQATQPAAEIENPIRRNATTTSTAGASASTGFDAPRVFAALAAVIGLILVLRWGVKRLVPRGIGNGSRAINVLARCHISHKQKILIVQIGRRLLVVGDGGQGLNTLCEISDPDESAALLAQMGKSPATSFERVLSRAVASGDDAQESPMDDGIADEELSSARRQLNGLAEKVRVVARQLNRA